MDEVKKQKMRQFANDEMMFGCVRDILENVIVNRAVNKDVYVLAAERIAIDVVKEAWKEVEKYKTAKAETTGMGGNIGL